MDADFVARLQTLGQELPRNVREEVVALGAVAIRPLVELLRDETSWGEAGPGKGWAPIHAVDLLADLKAADAIEPMLHALVHTEWIDILHDRIIQRLPEFGAPVLEPALALLGRTTEQDARHSLCDVLAKLGVRDDRIFRALCNVFAANKVWGAMAFYDYGDPAALPLLAEAIERFRPNFKSLTYESDLVELVEAHEHLGGVLPDEVQARVDGWFARWDAMRRQLFEPLRPARHVAPAQHKVGRNEPCPCGSGKKYKKCCIDAEEVRSAN
jgi:SEC-C motif